jgi:hypothetical protein
MKKPSEERKKRGLSTRRVKQTYYKEQELASLDPSDETPPGKPLRKMADEIERLEFMPLALAGDQKPC